MNTTDRKPAESAATFSVRPLTTAEAAQVAGGAGYLKIGDIKGESRIGLLLPAVQKAY